VHTEQTRTSVDYLVGDIPKVAGGDNTASEGELIWHVLQLVVELILRLPRGLDELFAVAVIKLGRVERTTVEVAASGEWYVGGRCVPHHHGPPLHTSCAAQR
jgi:hypothetical protein